MKGLSLILTAEKGCGGWSQYWPLSGNGSYQDYITFNDNLTTNVMKLLQEIIGNKGDFENLVDAETSTRCEAAFQKGLEVIIKCQVDDNGTKAAWCAQHDTTTFLPAEGRPHELPSISGSESASLLSFLMTIENPSEELKATITSAVEWLDAHKIEGKMPLKSLPTITEKMTAESSTRPAVPSGAVLYSWVAQQERKLTMPSLPS